MFRKLMAGAVLCSVPVLSFGVAQLATTGNALAAHHDMYRCFVSRHVCSTGPLGPRDCFGERQVDHETSWITDLVRDRHQATEPAP